MMSLVILGFLSISLIFSSAYAAPLRSQSAIPSNNIVSTTSTYEILFTTATTGTIKTIEIAFPVGYSIVGTGVIERTGIGPGTIQKAGTTIIYSVTSPVSIPANTPIRLELANIVNSNIKSAASVSITTKDSAGTKIDGPTLSSTFIRNIGTNDIAGSAVTTAKIGANAVTSDKIADQNIFTNDLANNAITGQKIGDGQINNVDIGDGQVTEDEVSPVLMYIRSESDTNCVPDQFGNMIGWCPDGSKQNFAIIDPDLEPLSFNKFVPLLVIVGGVDCRGYTGHTGTDGFMNVDCDRAPTEGSYLTYTAIGPKMLP